MFLNASRTKNTCYKGDLWLDVNFVHYRRPNQGTDYGVGEILVFADYQSLLINTGSTGALTSYANQDANRTD